MIDLGLTFVALGLGASWLSRKHRQKSQEALSAEYADFNKAKRAYDREVVRYVAATRDLAIRRKACAGWCLDKAVACINRMGATSDAFDQRSGWFGGRSNEAFRQLRAKVRRTIVLPPRTLDRIAAIGLGTATLIEGLQIADRLLDHFGLPDIELLHVDLGDVANSIPIDGVGDLAASLGLDGLTLAEATSGLGAITGLARGEFNIYKAGQNDGIATELREKAKAVKAENARLADKTATVRRSRDDLENAAYDVFRKTLLLEEAMRSKEWSAKASNHDIVADYRRTIVALWDRLNDQPLAA